MTSNNPSGSSSSSPSAEPIGARLTKAKRATVACTACRKRQVRCQKAPSGPDCQRCLKMNIKCEYIPLNVQRGIQAAEDTVSGVTSDSDVSAYAPGYPRMSPVSPGGHPVAEHAAFAHTGRSHSATTGEHYSSGGQPAGATWPVATRPASLRVSTDGGARSVYPDASMGVLQNSSRGYPAPMPVSMPASVSYANLSAGGYRSFTPSPSSAGIGSPQSRMGGYRSYTPSPPSASTASWAPSQQSPLARTGSTPWASGPRAAQAWSPAGDANPYTTPVVPPQLWSPTPVSPAQAHEVPSSADPGDPNARYYTQAQPWYEPAAQGMAAPYPASPSAASYNNTQEWQRRHPQY